MLILNYDDGGLNRGELRVVMMEQPMYNLTRGFGIFTSHQLYLFLDISKLR
jgi:hypothetical protein